MTSNFENPPAMIPGGSGHSGQTESTTSAAPSVGKTEETAATRLLRKIGKLDWLNDMTPKNRKAFEEYCEFRETLRPVDFTAAELIEEVRNGM